MLIVKNLKFICFIFACALIFAGATCVYATDDVANLNNGDKLYLDSQYDVEKGIFDENLNGETGSFNNGENLNDETYSFNLKDDHINIVQQKQDDNDEAQGKVEINESPCDVVSAGSVDDLAKDLQRMSPRSTYALDKDYIFNQDLHSENGNGILIFRNNITIDGKGHTIDGQNRNSIFEITSDDVKIINLNIINCNHATGKSPIRWAGDNGVISNRIFAGNNTAKSGGALLWQGDNGRIENCIFMNNAAKIAGDIYIDGTSNTIYNSTFINYTSQFANESIYVSRNGKYNTIYGTFNTCNGFLDGVETDFDAYHNDGSFLDIEIADKKMSIIPLLYQALSSDEINEIEGIEFYGEIVNDTYVLTFTKKFGNDITYEKKSISQGFMNWKIYLK